MNAQDSEEEFINTPKDFTPILTAKINSFLGRTPPPDSSSDSSSDYVGDPPPTVKKPAPSKKLSWKCRRHVAATYDMSPNVATLRRHGDVTATFVISDM